MTGEAVAVDGEGEAPEVAGIVRVTSELDVDAAENLRASFDGLFKQAAKWNKQAREISVTSSDQKREMKLARDSRLALKEIRVNAEKTRKKLKEESLRYGRAIDGMCNVLKALVEPTEAYLLEQETFAEREEEKKREVLRTQRLQVLDSYGADAGVYSDLGDMSEEQWTLVAEGARVARDARVEAEKQAVLAREEAARKEAEERAVVAKRIQAQAKENAKLRIDAKRVEAEKQKVEAELAVERAKLAEIEKAELVRVQGEWQRAKEENDEKQRLEAEQEALLMAPDREKLRAFADGLRALTVPVMTTRQGRAAQKKLTSGMAEMIAWVEKVSEELS